MTTQIPTTTMTTKATRSVFTTGGVGGVGKMVNSVMINSLILSSETDVARKTRSSEVCKNEIRRNDQGELTEIDQDERLFPELVHHAGERLGGLSLAGSPEITLVCHIIVPPLFQLDVMHRL